MREATVDDDIDVMKMAMIIFDLKLKGGFQTSVDSADYHFGLGRKEPPIAPTAG